ncbi:arylsulfatase [Sinomicrobium soli]|nr:arylsulfatase [Sinomicrobium sp. N-1-3-6]
MVINGYAQHGEKPNIILIYADDLGYSDVAAFGKEYGYDFIETPNIDRLATQGMRFRSAYAPAPICTASRAAILTGKSPARLGFEFVTMSEGEKYSWDDPGWLQRFADKALIPPPYTLTLPLDEVTIAEALKKYGYTTGIAGKWHVAPHYKRYLGWSPTHGPLQQGFDWGRETYGSHPYQKSILKRELKKYTREGDFPTDALTEGAIQFLKDHKDDTTPFFLYVSHYYVHTPIGDNVEWLIDKYIEKGKKQGRKIPGKQARYAAFVELFDHYVGQLLEAVDVLGLDENTLIVFTSDNGGNPAFACNGPFRGSKWNLYEGGVRVPMIARWPGKIEKGSVCDTPLIQTDFFPTFIELAGGSVNDLNTGPELDGVSVTSLFLDKDAPEALKNRTFIWHFPYYHPEGKKFDEARSQIGVNDGYISQTRPQSSIRKGHHKLIYFYEGESSELYDLNRDHSESVRIKSDEGEALKNELLKTLNDREARFPRKNGK